MAAWSVGRRIPWHDPTRQGPRPRPRPARRALGGCLFEVPPLVDEDDGDDATEGGSEAEASDGADESGDGETGDAPGDPPGEAPGEGQLAFVLYSEPHLLPARAGAKLRPLRTELAPGVDDPFLQISTR